MHLHSTQFLITKWPGTIYAPLCFFSCSPTDFCLGMLHFPPASLLCDGWLQLSTNNHSRSIWLHSFCLGWGNKIVLWKRSCFMRASLFVLGLFVVWRSHEKRIFTEQINFIEFLQGPHGQPFKRLQPLKLFLSVIIQRNLTVFLS